MPLNNKEMGSRLKQLRLVLGMSTQDFATEMFGGAPYKTYMTWENGQGPVSLPRAIMLIEQMRRRGHGRITMDWLYLGDLDGLTVGLAERLRDAEDTRAEALRAPRNARKTLPLPIDRLRKLRGLSPRKSRP